MKKYIPAILKYAVIAGILWGFVALLAGFVQAPFASNLALVEAYLASAFFTLLMYLSRRWWLDVLSGKGKLAAALAGIFCALVIETISWVTQIRAGTAVNTTDVNYWNNLLITIPWYIGWVLIFVQVQERRRFSWLALLLMGGLYKAIFVAVINLPVTARIMGGQISLLDSWIWLLRIGFWQYIVLYSSVVLVPAWILETRPVQPSALNSKPVWLDILRPGFWIIPYILFLFAYSLIPVIIATINNSGG